GLGFLQKPDDLLFRKALLHVRLLLRKRTLLDSGWPCLQGAGHAMMRSNVADEQVERIYAIADAFHEVPDAIARGTDLDPSLFVRCATDAGIVVPPDYPA
ncbi:hypothetical protein, partial [Burkholderia vietnamiensis]|uniref:hypothetical protein n=1 Tax=Burkholderia vietnamiensis TaxID=60552 RepID=UPI001ABB96DB